MKCWAEALRSSDFQIFFLLILHMFDFLVDVLQLRIKILSLEHTPKFAVLVLLWERNCPIWIQGHFA